MKKLIFTLALIGISINGVKSQQTYGSVPSKGEEIIFISSLVAMSLTFGILMYNDVNKRKTTPEIKPERTPEKILESSRGFRIGSMVLYGLAAGIALSATPENAVTNRDIALGISAGGLVMGIISQVEKAKWENSVTNKIAQHNKRMEQLKLQQIEKQIKQ